MAKEEKTAEVPKAKGKKKPILLFVIVGVGALVLGMGGFVAFKIMTNKSAAAQANPAAKEGHAAGGEAAGGEGAKIGGTITFDPFLVNLADKDANCYVKVTMRILVSDAEAAKTVSASDVLMPKMRDAILSILSSKLAADIITNEGKQSLKKEIMAKVNESLPGKIATDVFFTDFVVQR